MLITRVALAVLLTTTLLPATSSSTDAPSDSARSDSTGVTRGNWGLGMMVRVATIPFDTEDQVVSSVVPLLYYERGIFFVRGIEGGLTLYRVGDVDLNFLGRLHFFDIPKKFQNDIQGDGALWGLQAHYAATGPWYLDVEALSGGRRRFLGYLRTGNKFENRRWRLDSWAQLQWKSSEFNTAYYGLGLDHVGGGAEIEFGLKTDYHVISNFFLFGAGQFSIYDRAARNAAFVTDDTHFQVYGGFGFSDDKGKPANSVFGTGTYVRISQGWATPSTLGQIFRGDFGDDPYNNKLTTVFYGHRLSETLIGLPFEVFWHSGLGLHWKSSVQKRALEPVLSMKLYYTVPIPVRFRFGFAEGFSYATEVPYVERLKLAEKGYEPSNLMNYLDYSVDVNLGDVFRSESFKTWWLGFSIHHRSGIFTAASQFGRIKNDSNNNTVYLQYGL